MSFDITEKHVLWIILPWVCILDLFIIQSYIHRAPSVCHVSTKALGIQWWIRLMQILSSHCSLVRIQHLTNFCGLQQFLPSCFEDNILSNLTCEFIINARSQFWLLPLFFLFFFFPTDISRFIVIINPCICIAFILFKVLLNINYFSNRMK